MRTRLSLLAVVVLLAAGPALADGKKERDIFDYPAQKAASGVKKIVFVADTAPHGARGNHEFLAAAIYLARTINANYPDAYCVVHIKDQWPRDLKHADTIIVLLNHGASAVNDAVKEATARGAGFMAIHYGVEVNKGKEGDNYLKWIGGYFETFWSVNPWWTPEFKELPQHEVTRGVKPFSINDEWYYHMRFVGDMKGVTPILAAVPPKNTVQGEGKTSTTHGGNPAVWEEVSAGKKQVMAWAYERPEGGRGFGFTGLHKHVNLADDNFRTLLLNAVAWVSNLPVPEKGVPSKTPTRDELEKVIDDGKLAVQKLARPPAANLGTLWADLASPDEAKATRAALALAASKEAVPFLKEHLKPIKVEPKRVAQLLEQLDSDDFARREEAAAELDYLGRFVKADLEKAAATTRSAEVKKHVDAMLSRIAGETAEPGKAPAITGRNVGVSNVNGKITITVDGKVLDLTPPSAPTPRMPWIRAARVAAVLEFVGTPEARAVLERMADGEAEAPPTKAAKDALDRLKK